MADPLRVIMQSLDEIPLPPHDEWLPGSKVRRWPRALMSAAALIVAVAIGMSAGRLLQQGRDAAGPRAAASSAPATPIPFSERGGAVDPVAAAAKPSEVRFDNIRLAAGATPVSVRFVDGLPQSITVLDEQTGEDLYHVGSRFGPGNPILDQGFLQVFFAALHHDESRQLVLAYGYCQPVCRGASQILVISMNAAHRIVTEQLRLMDLKDAVTDVRDGALWVWQSDGSLQRFAWDAGRQEFTEP